MAEISFNCPNCGSEVITDESFAGNMAQCPGCNNTILIPMPGISEGLELGGFLIERRLGMGGMGEVWLATQTAMDRRVALKILSPALTGDSNFVSRFMEEVKMSAKLEHPNIITAFDAGNENGIYYLAMSYVDGVELEVKLKIDKIVNETEGLKIIRSIAEALKYAWDKFQILHRDIKPSNIMLDSVGNAKLMDMGISKSMSENRDLTMTGMIVGTPYYMSPEQARADSELDSRSDIYALGATLYHLVTGQVPYDASTAMGVLARHITEPFPPPQEKNPDLSDTCSVLLETMMCKKAESRQQDWDTVISDIDLVLDGKMPKTPRPEAGKSQVMQMSASQSLDRRKITNRPKKAKKKGHNAPATTSEAAKSKLPILIGISLVVMVLIVMGIIFGSKSEAKPEKAKPVLKTGKSSPKTPTPVKQIPKQSDNLVEMWKFAVEYGKNNPTETEQIIINFERVRQAGKNSKYEMMADIEIKRVEKKKKAEKQKKTAKLAEEQKKAAETEKQRIAEEKAEKLKAAEAEKQRQLVEKAEKEQNELLDTIAPLLISGKYRTAYKKLNGKSPALKKMLKELGGVEKTIYESFKKEIGKNISIDTTKGQLKVKIKRLKGKSIYIEEKSGKALMQKKLSLKILSEKEKLKRLSDLSDEAKAIYVGVNAMKQRKYSTAEKQFKNAGILSTALLDQLAARRLGKAEALARADLLKILLSVGIRNVNTKPEAIKAKLSKRKFSEKQYEELKKKVDDYRKKYDKSKFAKSHNPALATVLSSVEEVRMRDFNRPWLVKSLKLELVPIKPGTFMMGEKGKKHKVRLTKPFWMGKYEVTQEQYEKIMGNNPSNFKNSGKTAPVEVVSWNDAMEFCKKLTEKERKRLPKGYTFRLPTEAEWEYCCRAGTETTYSFGDSKGKLGDYGWIKDNSDGKTHPVGKKKPNPWGLYDMHGNVWEWCLDWYAVYHTETVSDPKGPGNGSYRVRRGGSWHYDAYYCRSAHRGNRTPTNASISVGFRVVLPAGQ